MMLILQAAAIASVTAIVASTSVMCHGPNHWEYSAPGATLSSLSSVYTGHRKPVLVQRNN